MDYFKRKESEIKTIYIGVDEKKFNPEIFNKEELIKKFKCKNKYKGKILISYICRIVEQKRPFLLFEVVKELSKLRNDFAVMVAGDGPLLKKLEKKVKDEKLENYFLFVGNVKKTEKIYAMSDLSINTSIKEGIALTSYESLSMGIPVVSSDVGGQKELISEDVGEIVPCIQDEKDILEFQYTEEEVQNYVFAIQKVLKNLTFYKENCRNRILNNFTLDIMIKNMEKEFTELANNPNKEKVENGIKLSENMDILKELISSSFIAEKQEYEWILQKFNTENIHIADLKKILRRNLNYEHTLEYKIKHPIVVALRKIGVYDNTKKILGI